MRERMSAMGGAARWYVAVLSVCFSVLLWSPKLETQQVLTAIRGGTLIDGNGGAPVPDALIVIEGNRIRSISQGGAPPAGATVIEAQGKYILPGLWDTHTHYHEWFPELLLNNGVTSVLVYNGNPWLDAQGEGIAKGKIFGPRFFLSGEIIGMIYMLEDKARIQANILQKREDAIKTVRDRKASGSKIIKVYTSVTPTILQAITAEAHRLGLKVSGHIGMGAKAAVLAGIDNLAHATGLPVPDLLRPEDLDKLPDMRVIDTGRLRVAFPKIGRRWDQATERWGPNPDLTEYPLFIEDPRRLMAFGLMDRSLAEDMIRLLVQKHVFIESCLGYTFRNVNDRTEEFRNEDQELLSDPNLQYIPGRYRMNVLDYSILEQIRPDELELMKKGYRNFQWFTKAFVEAGGKITTGMDTSSPYHATQLPGLAVRREMQLLVDAGVPPMKVLQAATKWAAELLNQEKDLGTLEAGKLADLVILRRDPLQDITAFRDIDLVMKDGKVMERGYHYHYKNPLPEPVERDLSYGDWLVSEIPTRITGVQPSTVVEGSGSFPLTLRGEEFVSSSQIQFGEQVLRTEFVSPTELRATVPAGLVTNPGTVPIRVTHRTPGWGGTNTVFLIVKFK